MTQVEEVIPDPAVEEASEGRGKRFLRLVSQGNGSEEGPPEENTFKQLMHSTQFTILRWAV